MSGIIQGLMSSFKSELKIGDAYEGGFYAGEISTSANGVATHRIVVAPKSSGENSSKQWKTTAGTGIAVNSVIDGPANSAALNSATYPAAKFCEDLSIGGFSDWYLPARDELDVVYFNLKPTTTSNTTSAGINDYSVPKRTSNFTAGNPAQTSVSDFQSGGTQAFTATSYWTSSSFDSSDVYFKAFTNGNNIVDDVRSSYYVRAIRRVAI